MGDVHALRAARGHRDPARLLEHRARPDGLWRERPAQLARGHRCLSAVVAARYVSNRGALEQGARRQDSRQMGARAAARIGTWLAEGAAKLDSNQMLPPACSVRRSAVYRKLVNASGQIIICRRSPFNRKLFAMLIIWSNARITSAPPSRRW